MATVGVLGRVALLLVVGCGSVPPAPTLPAAKLPEVPRRQDETEPPPVPPPSATTTTLSPVR